MEQIISVSINYFNYKTTIKFDIKYNRNENHPLFISIVNVFNDGPIILICKKLNLPLRVTNMREVIMDCPQQMNITSKDFLIDITNKWYDSIYNYSLELNNQVMNLKVIPTNHAYYFKLNYDFDEVIHFNTINITENQENVDHHGNELFKLWMSLIFTKETFYYEIYFNKIYLVLSCYNILNSYQIDFRLSSLSHDQIIKVTKVIHNNLRPPYGQCSDYVKDRPFNGTNHWHCYRQCIKTMAEKVFKCKLVLIGNTFHELDYINDNYIECNNSNQNKLDEYLNANNLETICMDRCPKNCLNIDFKMSWITKAENDEINYENKQRKITMIWDTTKPMFVYNEELVLSFIDYMCYCGGLVGLLFGASAVDILYKLLNKTIWINIFVIIKNIPTKVNYIFVSLWECLPEWRPVALLTRRVVQ